MKENTQKGQIYWGAGEVDRGGEGNPRVEERKKDKQGGLRKKRGQERETMDNNTLCYCTPNFHKLVCQAPLCGGILVSILYEIKSLLFNI